MCEIVHVEVVVKTETGLELVGTILNLKYKIGCHPLVESIHIDNCPREGGQYVIARLTTCTYFVDRILMAQFRAIGFHLVKHTEFGGRPHFELTIEPDHNLGDIFDELIDL